MTTSRLLRGFLAVSLLIFAAGTPGAAQERPGEELQPEMGMAGQQMPMGPTEMQDMARAMESMADMCRMMMQREMQYKPYLMIIGAAVAALLIVALLLLIVLEVQAIRYLSVRVKSERQKLA